VRPVDEEYRLRFRRTGNLEWEELQFAVQHIADTLRSGVPGAEAGQEEGPLDPRARRQRELGLGAAFFDSEV
jgi:hypothetical protein